MTSTDAEPTGVDPFLTATPDQVEMGIVRELRKQGYDYPVKTADDAMVPVRPVLEAKDAEIARLRERLESVRADECERCVVALRAKADRLIADMYDDEGEQFHRAADLLEAGTVPAEDTGEGEQR